MVHGTRHRYPAASARWLLAASTAALCAGALAAPAAGARAAPRPHRPPQPSAAQYPAGATRPAFVPRPSQFAHAAKQGRSRRTKRRPGLRGNPARALVAFAAMQRYYYVPGAGLYEGEPFSYLWPFSQALAATLSVANIHGAPSVRREIHARMLGLGAYLDTNNSGSDEGAYTSTLPAFDGTVAPPIGPGGTKYYDDNDWVGIELLRAYSLIHDRDLLASAQALMAFEMAAWQTNPELPCAGGIPFSNAPNNTDRNTVTTAPAAQLAARLYSITHNPVYLQFAQMAYEWVRHCLLQPSGLYSDHINTQGFIDRTLWSYGQGTMIGAGALLYQATGNRAYLNQARQSARAALSYFTPERLGAEIPFFPSVYFRNLLYLDSLTQGRSGRVVAQSYVDYAWQHQRLTSNLFVAGSPASAQLLVQAAITQIYALLSTPPSSYF